MTSSTKPGGRSADRDPAAADALAAELTRLAEGYRRLPHSKFALRLEPYGDRAQAGYWLASQVTTVAQGIERWDSPRPPLWHRLPALGVFALGDQIAVVGNDLLAAYRALKDPRETLIWTPGDGRVPAEKAMAAVLESTAALRRAL
ncbi:hypothetical protein [Catenulispora pinisilvae]|uniref:hypothetical protein n=1 Tax=Catenulispora pinisilvae TaxID=2705253 RepID=UPI001891A491|nr:hypothetical protein [Catenulispora pinisilvae]